MAIILTLTGLTCHPREQANKLAFNRDRLVSAEAKETISSAELKQTYGQLADYIKNGYTAYRITYNTTHTNGKEIVASGAIFVPDITTELPLFNYNHGTYFPSQEKEAPSYLGFSYELIMGKLYAGAGYLVVMPDYPGYGASKNIAHPYGAYHEIAGSVIDMLYAVKEFCAKQDITLSGKNFFSGWSEGAAVALATVKALEEDHKGEFSPTATVLNAGPYYSSGFVHHILDARQPLKHMNTYAWILQSYNSIYRINRPLNYYFNEPAATDLQNGPEMSIPRDPQELFTGTFISNYKSGKDTALENALVRNDLWNWKPGSKIVFCHGDKDDYVPLFNSEKAYSAMKAKGADVTLHVFKGANHSSGILNFVRVAFNHFEKAR
ncbi:MAG: alpha/beta hydrolase family protein [Chitinophagaceae bacterium]